MTDPMTRFPHHQNPDELVVTRDDQVVRTLPCQRIEIPGRDRWESHHIGAHVGATRDGVLYAMISGVFVTSADRGVTWQDAPVRDMPTGGFSLLRDDTFMAVAGGGDQPMTFHESSDRGATWKKISTLERAPFDVHHADSNPIELDDGSLLMPAIFQFNEPTKDLPQPSAQHGIDMQYMLRSTDRGRTWQNLPDAKFWSTVHESHFKLVGVSKDTTFPGPGGSFPGCYETDLMQLPDGRVLSALRYSGWSQPWHDAYAKRWGAVDEADTHGRVFRHIMLGTSTDRGRTWQDLRPVADETGHTVLQHGDCNGELVRLPDGRLVLIYQRRYPRGWSQHAAHVSEDEGRTWSRDVYLVMAGFGYSGSVVLDDGTIITVNGQAFMDEFDQKMAPFNAQVIRWRVD